MILTRVAVLSLFALTACPAQSDGKKDTAPVTKCTRVGQQCEFAPGKLGACVAKESCDGPDCFTCQSQH